ncbi:hypothetical protein IDJ77_06605 [Mucilaginibacter sp. ZT4R22]|uniref:Uncharacterized protein n=1 Tax=Mucilaginibacter pankratovii TaxID=2772110 RepID=A0ABR7WMB8_9SPHI|nr:hypothetical protein [Mucilaginibacter pankratovii]MBD1363474.1 hypothetical protein [Mucilaginibacter pankratovii]
MQTEKTEVDEILIQRLKDLIKYHKGRVVSHSTMVTTYTDMLSKLLGTDEVVEPILSNQAQHKKLIPNKTKRRKTSASNYTLKAVVMEYISENETPLSANALREKYNTIVGKEIKVSNFSPRIAELTKNGDIAKVVIEGNPIKSKFLYALPEWLDNNGVLKEEFMIKVKAGL